MELSRFDARPILVAVAGPDGAGKTAFYHAHLEPAGLRFVNADVLARELGLSPYDAARVATVLRRELVSQRESFVFETVFSDPVGEKIGFLREASESGYTVVLCFVGIANAGVSETRVAMRVTQGGHDVPRRKLRSRFPRTIANLGSAIHVLPHVLVFDNDDLGRPFRRVAVFDTGRIVESVDTLPPWLRSALRKHRRDPGR